VDSPTPIEMCVNARQSYEKIGAIYGILCSWTWRR